MNRRNVIYVIISLVAGIAISALFTELSFAFLRQSNDRVPETISLTIPAGTAAKVALGQKPPSIPDDMTFVVGDTLVVYNDDFADHTLGPLFIPAGTKATITFDKAEQMSYACSFTPVKFLGMEVKEPLTLSTRILGILSAGVPMGVLFALYVVFAIAPEQKRNQAA